jgi:hypothetical protein
MSDNVLRDYYIVDGTNSHVCLLPVVIEVAAVAVICWSLCLYRCYYETAIAHECVTDQHWFHYTGDIGNFQRAPSGTLCDFYPTQKC